MGRERDVTVIIILVQNWSPIRSTIFHPFPHQIILIIERKMDQLVNEITFFTHLWAGDLLKSETKVVVDIDKLIKFLVRQPIANSAAAFSRLNLSRTRSAVVFFALSNSR